MTYSLDFRKKVLSIRSKEKLSFAQVAKRFGISVNSVFLWSKRLEPRLTKSRPAIKIDREILMEDIKKHPDAFNYERAHRLNVSTSGIRCAMKRLRISYKKNTQSSQGLRRKKGNLSRKHRKIWMFGKTDCIYWWKRVCPWYAPNSRLLQNRAALLWHSWLGSKRKDKCNRSITWNKPAYSCIIRL